MTMQSLRVDEVERTVTVKSGSGSALFNEGGRIDGLSVKVPSGSPTWDIELLTNKDTGVYGICNQSGSLTSHVNRLIPSGGNQIIMSNVSADGDYTVTLWLDRGL